MSQDGAHLGVAAGKALEAVLGGKQPTDEERLSQQEFAEWIRSTPFDLKDIEGENPYTEASRWLALRYLTILEDAPAIDADTAYQVFKTKWPDDAKEAGDMTGFMHGWAWNAARHTLKYNPQPNPAIITIGLRKPPFWKRIALYRLARQMWAKRYDWLKVRFV